MALGEMVPLSEIPCLDKAQISPDRFLSSLTFHDEAWHTWIHVSDNNFMEIQGWPSEAFYVGLKPEHPTDLSLTFLDFMAHSANFIELKQPFAAIQDDTWTFRPPLQNLS